MTLTEQVIEALKIDFDEVYQSGYEKGYADASNGTTSSFVGTVPTDSTEVVEQIINAGKIELDGVYQAGYEKGYAEGSGGSDEVVLLYEPFDTLDTNVWTITNTGDLPETPCPIEIREDTEQGNVLYIGAKTSSNKVRRLQHIPVSIPTDVTEVNVSFKYKVEGTSAGAITFVLYEYADDESNYEYNAVLNTKSSNDGWVEFNETVTRETNYPKIAFRINCLATVKVPIYVDDIKITY